MRLHFRKMKLLAIILIGIMVLDSVQPVLAVSSGVENISEEVIVSDTGENSKAEAESSQEQSEPVHDTEETDSTEENRADTSQEQSEPVSDTKETDSTEENKADTSQEQSESVSDTETANSEEKNELDTSHEDSETLNEGTDSTELDNTDDSENPTEADMPETTESTDTIDNSESSDVLKEESEPVVSKNILTYDNTERIQNEGLSDPFMKLNLSKETDFEETMSVYAEVLQNSNAILESLLSALQGQTVEMVLPVDISLSNNGTVIHDAGEPVNVKFYMDDISMLENTVLYHQKEDESWEQLDFVSESSETDLPYIEFVTNSFSPFMFVRVSNAKPAEVDSDTELCFVSAFEMGTIVDGIGPFDTEEAPGNDISESNHIVRSFDDVNYTLKYSTAIDESAVIGIDSAYLMVDFSLPYSEKIAKWNMDTMNWCLDPVITYEYSDGTSSTEIDQSKTVVNQRLTGKRLLVNGESGEAIPGTGTLSSGIKVYAAPNGTKIQPEFNIWMEGNPEEQKKSFTSEAVTVSAAPNYNVQLVGDEGHEYLGYYDMSTGKIAGKPTADSVYGRIQRYAVVIQLYNDYKAKGLKGIEFPQGDITFDVRVSMEITKKEGDQTITEDVTDNPDSEYQVHLWDYMENSNGHYLYQKGHHGRWMGQPGISFPAWYGPCNMILDNGGNPPDRSCYNGGNITLTQDETEPNVYHCTVSGYQFDYENYHFPKRYVWSNEGTVQYEDNVGCFACMNMQMLTEFPPEVPETITAYQQVDIENFQASSTSGVSGNEMLETDNHARRPVVLYPKGYLVARQRYDDRNRHWLSSWEEAGDASAHPGQKIQIESLIEGYCEYHFSDFNLLQKFDDEIIEIEDGTFEYQKGAPVTNPGTITTLWAAKPDKTGWSSDKEMSWAQEENLIYFSSIQELKAAGYTCVGVLYEIRNCEINSSSARTFLYQLYLNAKIKENRDTIGKVYQITNELRAWIKEVDPQGFSWTDLPSNGDGAFGIGAKQDYDRNHVDEYAEGYVKPYMTVVKTQDNYGKVWYEDGVIHGHTGGYMFGNSILIIGNYANVSVEGADKNGEDTKSTYDLDAGERTAHFSIKPELKVAADSQDVHDSDDTDNVTVKVTLPKNLHFNKANQTPESITENADGTTTLIWTYENVKVRELMEEILISTTIGEEGTVNDPVNNEQLTVIAQVQSDNDPRNITVENGNYDAATISIVKLAASSVTKRVIRPLVESGDEIEYRLRYSNLSGTAEQNIHVYDRMPYSHDERGTEFTGKYIVTELKMDFSHAGNTFNDCISQVYYSSAEENRTIDKRNQFLKSNTLDDTFTMLSNGSKDSANKTITYSDLALSDVSALFWQYSGIAANEYVDMYIKISPVGAEGQFLKDADGKVQLPGNVYANSFGQYADNQVDVVSSNMVLAQVVNRKISGVAWEDANKNGIRDTQETSLSNVDVTLYRTEPSKYDMEHTPVTTIGGQELYEAYDALGQKVTSIKTRADGSYLFEYLESGVYQIVFDPITNHYVTLQDAGEDDTLDSDAEVVDTAWMISDIKLPELENMIDAVYDSPHHDIGVLHVTNVLIQKVDQHDNPLPGASLALYETKDIENNQPKTGAVPVAEWTSDSSEGYELYNELIDGYSYTLIEKAPPEGYLLAEPVTFTVKKAATVQKVVMKDEQEVYSLSISKTVTGSMGDKTKQFTFQLSISGNEPLVSLHYTKGDTSGELPVTDNQATFTLAHGEKIVFDNVPSGVSYEISEQDGVSNGYMVTSTNESGKIESNIEVSFTNKKDSPVPTSADTNTKVFLMIVSIVVFVVGFVWILYRRKRN